MPSANIQGLEVSFLLKGSGPPLLMLSPGGFDATIEAWNIRGVWSSLKPLDNLAEHFTLIAYDRRECGASGGRVEELTWALYADQAKALLDHLEIPGALILAGCMGCPVAIAFANRYPAAARALMLHWPVGGYRWRARGYDRFGRHLAFARANGLPGVVARARAAGSFWQDAEAGPWASCIAGSPAFADAFLRQDPARYIALVAATNRFLHDRYMTPGAEPEQLMAMNMPTLVIPGDDPAHATSVAHHLRELLPDARFCETMPPGQSPELVRRLILDFAAGR